MIGIVEYGMTPETGGVSLTHRVLIAAAVTAALGPQVRIGEIRPVRETRPMAQIRAARVRMETARIAARGRAKIRLKPRRETRKSETPNQG